MEGLVSVIIPTFNREHIIKDAIDTVLNQTYQNFEIIIIDDGSTDNTKEIVEKIDDARIKYIYKKNQGKPSIARNIGVKNAKGEFIAFLDSDDLWGNRMLEKHIIAHKNADIGFSVNWSSYGNFEGKEFLRKFCHAEHSKDYLKHILLHPDFVYTGTGAALIKRECFDKIGFFDETMTFCEDWDFFCRLSIEYNFRNIKEVLTYIRMHKGSLTKTSCTKDFEDGYLKFLDKAYMNKNISPEVLKTKKEAYSNAFWVIGSWALKKNEDYKTAKENFVKSLKLSPKKVLNFKFMANFIFAFLPKIFFKAYKKLKVTNS